MSVALFDVGTRQERCIPDLFGKKLSPKLWKQPVFAKVKIYNSYSSLVKKYDIFFTVDNNTAICFRIAFMLTARNKIMKKYSHICQRSTFKFLTYTLFYLNTCTSKQM